MKKRVAILFGGQSSEHDVSCISATTIIKNMDDERYEKILVGITKEGRWLRVASVEDIESGAWRESKVSMILSPDRSHQGLLAIKDSVAECVPVDVVFPVLHGLYGEDGTVQGILELSGIPYVGCGVVASAVSMDKLFTKIIVDSLGSVRQAQYVSFFRSELTEEAACIAKVEAALSYPVFIKPSNAGSSKGVSKAKDAGELMEGLKEAARHDEKILVEETIIGREIECAVLGGKVVKASGVGEVLAAESADFYDFEAKYHNAESKTDLHPVFPEGKEEEVRNKAIAIFKAVDGFGCSRVDFFLEKDTNEVIFNEINTLPGFTAISMYPMLWEVQGIKKKELIDQLLQMATQRHQ